MHIAQQIYSVSPFKLLHLSISSYHSTHMRTYTLNAMWYNCHNTNIIYSTYSAPNMYSIICEGGPAERSAYRSRVMRRHRIASLCSTTVLYMYWCGCCCLLYSSTITGPSKTRWGDTAHTRRQRRRSRHANAQAHARTTLLLTT